MELLATAVVDITMLASTCHALRSTPLGDDLAMQRRLRKRLLREIERGTLAYIDALARAKAGAVDEARLAACRLAAEEQMAHAIEHQGLLSRIMASEAGSLDGAAASRHDLWRLAQMAIYLRIGTATPRGDGEALDAPSAGAMTRRLRRRFRKALIAYARVIVRARKSKRRLIATARACALAEIGMGGAAEAERLADIEAGGDPTRTVIRQGVAKPLFDLALDWQPDPLARPAIG